MKQIVMLSCLLMTSLCSCVHINTNSGGVSVSMSDKSFDGAPSKVITTNEFVNLQNQGPLSVIYRQGDKYEVSVEGDEKMFDVAVINVKDSKVEISAKPGHYNDLWLRVVVTSPKIEELWQSGSGSITCQNIKNQPNLKMWVSGSGDLTADSLECQELSSKVSGSGNMTLQYATCNNNLTMVSGSGNLMIGNQVVANVLAATVSGSGNTIFGQVNVLDTFKTTISGSGNVQVNGYAESVTAKVSGSGSVNGSLTYERIQKEKHGSGSINL